jgi:hypothetical protein
MNPFNHIKPLLAILFCCILGMAQAQFGKEVLKNNKYQIGVSAFLSTSENLPFWLRTNQYGEVPLKSQFLQFSGSVHHEYDSIYTKEGKLNKFGWGYGARAVANVGKVNQFILSEGYLKARFSAFEIYIGRRKEIFGLVDTTLTSGSYIWSGNALPLPKLQISIPNYTPILKNGLISIKGGYAHGWFDKERLYTSDLKLHQKWLYFRLGKPSWKINFFAGGNHQAQWGGYSPFYTVNGKLPDGFKNYLHVVLGTRGAIKGVSESSDFDANRIGNHLGSIDIAASIKLKQSEFLVYRQSFYEDGSLFYLNNISDGLYGLSLKIHKQILGFNNVNFLVEYLNTSNQGGNVFFLFSNVNQRVPDELRGSDSYFNNAQIGDGWVNNNKTIGTPFISVPNQESNININRVKVWHLALYANFNSLSFYIKNSLAKNLGTYDSPEFGKPTLNSLMHIGKRIGRNDLLSINLSSNPTTRLGKTIVGLNIGYTKSF